MLAPSHAVGTLGDIWRIGQVRRFLKGFAAAVIGFALTGAAYAQSSSNSIKIGILGDESGPYADVGGPGSVVAAQMAVDDFGGSVLGKHIELLVADDQDNPDVGTSIARKWFDTEDVVAITDGAPSSVGLSVQSLAQNRKRIFLITGSTTSDLTDKACSPTGMQFVTDTYSISVGTTRSLAEKGAKKWFFLIADYNFGYALQRDATAVVEETGASVVGNARAPLGTADFSSYLLQAQSSGADVLAFGVAGTDLINAVKQAHEFGIARNGLTLAALQLTIADVEGIGLEAAQGLTSVTPFYWDMNDGTRAWTKRFMQRRNQVPTRLHAATYSAVMHYLQAVQAAGTTDADKVAAKMQETPVDDPIFPGAHVREDGRVMMDFFMFQVKSPADSKYPHDDYKLLDRIPAAQVFRPLAKSQCPYIHAKQ
jgi:branched-chain amino acid transport system substrate-binding protein